MGADGHGVSGVMRKCQRYRGDVNISKSLICALKCLQVLQVSQVVGLSGVCPAEWRLFLVPSCLPSIAPLGSGVCAQPRCSPWGSARRSEMTATSTGRSGAPSLLAVPPSQTSSPGLLAGEGSTP